MWTFKVGDTRALGWSDTHYIMFESMHWQNQSDYVAKIPEIYLTVAGEA